MSWLAMKLETHVINTEIYQPTKIVHVVDVWGGLRMYQLSKAVDRRQALRSFTLFVIGVSNLSWALLHRCQMGNGIRGFSQQLESLKTTGCGFFFRFSV